MPLAANASTSPTFCARVAMEGCGNATNNAVMAAGIRMDNTGMRWMTLAILFMHIHTV